MGLRKHILLFACAAIAAQLFPVRAAAQGEIKVAVAANFAGTLEKLAKEFAKSGGAKVAIIPGSSGKLLEQIRNGAPFDLFLSADAARPETLEKEGLAAKGSRFTYAIGRLALWASAEGKNLENGNILSQGAFARLSIANPKTAPYGAAAMQTLEKMGLREKLQAKIVTGENIAQAFQFVETGNAELGFVALPQILERAPEKRGSHWLVPETMHDPIAQQAVLMEKSPVRAQAEEFLKFMKSDAALKIIEADGYRLPPTEAPG